jgi:AraC-like DNA-binding protein
LCGLVRELGGDGAALLHGAGLAPGALDRPQDRIPYGALGCLLEEAARQTHHPQLALVAGRMCRLEDLGDLGEIVRHSDTVASALEALVAYQHLHGEGGLLYLARRGAIAEVGYAIYYPGVEGASHIYDYMLAALHNVLRELCGCKWLPSEVFLPHARPDNVSNYRLLFKTQPHFDADVCALRFPAYWLDQRVETASTTRRATSIVRALRCQRPDFLQRVFRALRHALIKGRTSGDEVAQMLSMHRRTLNRRLRANGATFQSALDEVRLEVARQLLCESNATLDDIAATLGYAGVSGFMRRYKQRTGMTPASARRTARRAALARAGAAPGECPSVAGVGEAFAHAAPRTLRFVFPDTTGIDRPAMAPADRANAGPARLMASQPSAAAVALRLREA